MVADDAGVLERMWRCAGRRVVESPRAKRRRLLVSLGMLPLVIIPTWYDPLRREDAFGWALAMVAVERAGWLPLVTQLTTFDSAVLSDVAAASDVAD